MALSLGVIAEYLVFVCVSFAQTGPRDGDQFLVFHTLQYWNATSFGMAKQWTPLMCAGLSMAGEPQVPFLSLSMALSYIFGPLVGVKSAVIAYLIIGWVGAYLYSGLWLTIPRQRILAASLYIGNGFFFCRLGFGHFDFIPFLILPLLLWAIHGAESWTTRARQPRIALQLTTVVLLLSAVIALAIDGSPVAIIHLMLWVGIYVLAFSCAIRSLVPVGLFAAAVAVAALLDAGYLWPMLQAQAGFPRLTPDRFTSFFSLIYFAILPIRGKLLPANGNGHELSVFIGPMLAYCLYHERKWLFRTIPPTIKNPLVVVSVISVVLGMGSLKGLHIPAWLSPFDILRPLPGFRSIGVTGRYWGFLALPLSLLSAAALFRFPSNALQGWRLHGFFALVLVFQLGFQAETLTKLWLHSPEYKLAPQGQLFRKGPENVDYVVMHGKTMQGALLTPIQGVSDCYDMDDFVRTGDGPGNNLVLSSNRNGKPLDQIMSVQARFATWSDVRVTARCQTSDVASCRGKPDDRITMEFRQAYHEGWHSAGCTTYEGARGNLFLDCPATSIGSVITLTFNERGSAIAATMSLAAWTLWVLFLAILIHAQLVLRMRSSNAVLVHPVRQIGSTTRCLEERLCLESSQGTGPPVGRDENI